MNITVHIAQWNSQGITLLFTFPKINRDLHKKPMFVQDINKCTPLTKNETSLRKSKRFSVPGYPEANEGIP